MLWVDSTTLKKQESLYKHSTELANGYLENGVNLH